MANIGDLEKKINSELTTKIKESEIKHNQLYITINSEDLLDVILLLKTNKNTKFRQLIDITAVDYPENQKRFKIVYLLLSHEFNQRIILSYFISENEKISSLTKIFPSANWMEREIFDMYGIKFSDHPDLRRILTDYGFEGHPLRKDFPYGLNTLPDYWRGLKTSVRHGLCSSPEEGQRVLLHALPPQ